MGGIFSKIPGGGGGGGGLALADVVGAQQWQFRAYDFSQVAGETTRTQSGAANQFDSLSMAATGYNWAATPVIMPNRWDEGQFRFRVAYVPTTTNIGVVEFSLFGESIADGDAIPSPASVGATLADTTNGTADDIHITDWSSFASFGGSPALNELIMMRVQRNGDNPADTYTGTVEMIIAQVEWVSNAATDD